MNIRNRIARVNQARKLIKDLILTLDESLHIQDCDAQYYCHFHSSYPDELFNALALASGILNDWNDDLHSETTLQNRYSRQAV